MNFCKTLTYRSPIHLGRSRIDSLLFQYSIVPKCSSPIFLSTNLPFRRNPKCCRVITACFNTGQEIIGQESETLSEKVEKIAIVSAVDGQDEENRVEIVESERKEFSGNDSIWSQMVEIAKFSGPAVGLWLCGPVMSLIDTAVIGQGSSTELAALGR